MLEWSALSEPVNVIGIGVVKISVCLCLIGVVDKARRRISRFLWILIAFIIVTHLGLALVFFLHCIPLAALWNHQVQGQCMSTHTAVLAGYVGFGKYLRVILCTWLTKCRCRHSDGFSMRRYTNICDPSITDEQANQDRFMLSYGSRRIVRQSTLLEYIRYHANELMF